MSIGISDTRGIREALFLNWDKDKVEFLSWAGNNGLFNNGLDVRLPKIKTTTNTSHSFSFELSFNGNETSAIAAFKQNGKCPI